MKSICRNVENHTFRLKVENMTFLIAFKLKVGIFTYYDNVKFMINTIYHLYKNEWKSQSLPHECIMNHDFVKICLIQQ